jgi:hypothetical protein
MITLLLTVVTACAGIHDHDLRLLCEAEATRDPSYCAVIRDHDLRALCLARVTRRETATPQPRPGTGKTPAISTDQTVHRPPLRR